MINEMFIGVLAGIFTELIINIWRGLFSKDPHNHPGHQINAHTRRILNQLEQERALYRQDRQLLDKMIQEDSERRSREWRQLIKSVSHSLTHACQKEVHANPQVTHWRVNHEGVAQIGLGDTLANYAAEQAYRKFSNQDASQRFRNAGLKLMNTSPQPIDNEHHKSGFIGVLAILLLGACIFTILFIINNY